jgi:hypothetical protein
VSFGSIWGGDGDDSISGTGTGGGGAGYGITNVGSVWGGDGDDSISGTGTGTSSAAYGGIGFFNVGIISGGAGDDSISGTGTTDFGIYNANDTSLSGGAGNDFIAGTGGQIGIANNSIISGGAGNDTITGAGTSVGIGGGSLEGNDGNDYFKARRIDTAGNPVEDQGGAISGALILGGKGDDTFDLGWGNAIIKGGDGWDKLILLGSSGEYAITGTSCNGIIGRDNLVLKVINVEEIIFV